MSVNPLYSSNQSPTNTTQPTKSVNRQSVNVHRTHNTFDNSYFHFKTQKFGQYEPFFVCEGVPQDNITLHSSHNVRALPFSSPFLTSLTLNKDYFMIPNQAIQPNTWEYIYRQPSQGDDVPFDAQNLFPVYQNSGGTPSLLVRFIDSISSNLEIFNSSIEHDSSFFEQLVFSFLTAELFFSSGSLLSNLGYKLSPRFIVNGEADSGTLYRNGFISFDDLFDRFFRSVNIRMSVSLPDDAGNLNYTTFDTNYNYTKVSMYTMISLLRRYGSDCQIEQVSYIDGIDPIYLTYYDGLPSFTDDDDSNHYIRMDRVCAYQLACAQYYVNPQVDFIYNAQLFRDNFFSLWARFQPFVSSAPQSFIYNGLSVLYDYFSLKYYSKFYSPSINSSYYDCLSYLFGFRESLRFGDYFTDSRTQALAPGSDSVPVVGDNVSVIDMSRSIIYQRFRNAVVKLGNNFEDYLRGILGSNPSPDYHYPKFISHNDFVISGTEIANTTDNGQGNLVTNLQSADDTFAFEVSVDMPCVIIGLSYFSVPRVYSQTKDRPFFHQDRFDFFNPMLQYDIDQEVYTAEMSDLIPTKTFGYQSRYGEYKQRFGIVSGGFVSTLPSWTFLTDSLFNPVTDIVLYKNQSPDFIRAHDFEFNRFLSSIPGVSMGNGFHFIVVYNNKSPQVRPMEVNPNTL